MSAPGNSDDSNAGTRLVLVKADIAMARRIAQGAVNDSVQENSTATIATTMVKLSIAKMAVASRCSNIQGVAAPYLASGGYSAKTPVFSILPYLARCGTAKYGTEAAALPYLPYPL
jgi:hypothetical protein